jgi:hypothetical protein
LKQHSAADVALCSVVLGELLYGAEHGSPVHRSNNLALVARCDSSICRCLSMTWLPSTTATSERIWQRGARKPCTTRTTTSWPRSMR